MALSRFHHGRRIRTSHAEIYQGNAIGSHIGHRSIRASDRYVVVGGEPCDVIAEVRQENMFSEFIKRRSPVTREPVFYELLFFFHFLLPREVWPIYSKHAEL